MRQATITLCYGIGLALAGAVGALTTPVLAGDRVPAGYVRLFNGLEYDAAWRSRETVHHRPARTASGKVYKSPISVIPLRVPDTFQSARLHELCDAFVTYDYSIGKPVSAATTLGLVYLNHEIQVARENGAPIGTCAYERSPGGYKAKRNGVVQELASPDEPLNLEPYGFYQTSVRRWGTRHIPGLEGAVAEFLLTQKYSNQHPTFYYAAAQALFEKYPGLRFINLSPVAKREWGETADTITNSYIGGLGARYRRLALRGSDDDVFVLRRQMVTVGAPDVLSAHAGPEAAAYRGQRFFHVFLEYRPLFKVVKAGQLQTFANNQLDNTSLRVITDILGPWARAAGIDNVYVGYFLSGRLADRRFIGKSFTFTGGKWEPVPGRKQK